jgi:hypothetical protein
MRRLRIAGGDADYLCVELLRQITGDPQTRIVECSSSR